MYDRWWLYIIVSSKIETFVWNPGGAGCSEEVSVPRDGLQVSVRAAHQDLRDQPGLPGSGQVNRKPAFHQTPDPSSLPKCAVHPSDTRSASTSLIRRAKVSSPPWMCSGSSRWETRPLHRPPLIFISRHRSEPLFSLPCRASMSTLVKTLSMKSLMRWTSTRTDRWRSTSSCRYEGQTQRRLSAVPNFQADKIFVTLSDKSRLYKHKRFGNVLLLRRVC